MLRAYHNEIAEARPDTTRPISRHIFLSGCITATANPLLLVSKSGQQQKGPTTALIT